MRRVGADLADEMAQERDGSADARHIEQILGTRKHRADDLVGSGRERQGPGPRKRDQGQNDEESTPGKGRRETRHEEKGGRGGRERDEDARREDQPEVSPQRRGADRRQVHPAEQQDATPGARGCDEAAPAQHGSRRPAPQRSVRRPRTHSPLHQRRQFDLLGPRAAASNQANAPPQSAASTTRTFTT